MWAHAIHGGSSQPLEAAFTVLPNSCRRPAIRRQDFRSHDRALAGDACSSKRGRQCLLGTTVLVCKGPNSTQYFRTLTPIPADGRLRRALLTVLSWVPQKGCGREICRRKGTPGRLCSPRKVTDPAARWGGMGAGRNPIGGDRDFNASNEQVQVGTSRSV